jgi:electron transfer flavoprotein alpha subunit
VESLIVVIVEHYRGTVSPATYEAIACAREIMGLLPSQVVVISVGQDAEERATDVCAATGARQLALHVPGLDGYNGDAYRTILARVLTELDPAWVCVPGTAQGLDFAPGLTVRLGGDCISGVQRVGQERSTLVCARTLFNGKIVAEMTASTRPTVLLVRPGAFKAVVRLPQDHGSVAVRTVQWRAAGTRALGVKSVEAADPALGEASVIVSAGRGVVRRENLELVRRVASLFSRSAVAGSRPLCDLGWLPYTSQVGQTGATVSPDMYFACGISGAQQHLAGMRGSKLTVAVNTDPHAAIFNEADLGIVEDVEGFLSDLLEVWAQLQASGFKSGSR